MDLLETESITLKKQTRENEKPKTVMERVVPGQDKTNHVKNQKAKRNPEKPNQIGRVIGADEPIGTGGDTK